MTGGGCLTIKLDRLVERKSYNWQIQTEGRDHKINIHMEQCVVTFTRHAKLRDSKNNLRDSVVK